MTDAIGDAPVETTCAKIILLDAGPCGKVVIIAVGDTDKDTDLTALLFEARWCAARVFQSGPDLLREEAFLGIHGVGVFLAYSKEFGIETVDIVEIGAG